MTYNRFGQGIARPTEFATICESRRRFLGSGVVMGTVSLLLGGGAFGIGGSSRASERWLSFDPVPANNFDTVTVPKGFHWHVVCSWGDPLWSCGTAFDHLTRGTGESQKLAFGDNNDGMSVFRIDGRTVMVVNHEYINRSIMYGNRESKLPENSDDIRKSKAGHGVSVVEIAHTNGRWSVVRDSRYNRRITADTRMELTGPARGHELLRTTTDPLGTHSSGTWNNCGSGKTPWGTHLACEENFNGYFSSSDKNYMPSAALKRYGVKNNDRGYAWARLDPRFDISKHPNEPNRVGYIVEIDPANPHSTPKKRTALGRMKHENAEVVINKDARIVVYQGDDERGEFLYRFVSAGRYVEAGSNTDLLEDGALFAAQFTADGRGKWIELTPEATGMKSKAEICIHTRLAASAVRATTMDRPEWVAANPERNEVACCLTNNKSRGKKPNAGGDPTPVDGPNPRAGNTYGQIVRWIPDDEDHTTPGFSWDLFVIAGNPTVHTDDRAGSANITPDNMFNSPDGLAYDSRGGLWIQTDGKYSNAGDFAGQGNNQMLRGDTTTGAIKRFLVGPKECEVTGACWSPDQRTMFVGIQHPGERGGSHFPDNGNTTPRSSVIAIGRDDGGLMG